MVRVHSGLPVISLNLLSRHRQSLRDFRQLVTIRHHSRKIFDCLALMRGNGHRVYVGSRKLGVTKLGLGVLDRSACNKQKRCMRTSEAVPAQPRSPDLLAGGFQFSMENVGVVERSTVA